MSELVRLDILAPRDAEQDCWIRVSDEKLNSHEGGETRNQRDELIPTDGRVRHVIATCVHATRDWGDG